MSDPFIEVARRDEQVRSLRAPATKGLEGTPAAGRAGPGSKTAPMAAEPADQTAALCRELIALVRTVESAEAAREQRLERKLAELDAQLEESARVQRLITGGAACREARLRALEDAVEAIAAEPPRMVAPRPLDVPRRRTFDASVVDMSSADPEQGA